MGKPDTEYRIDPVALQSWREGKGWSRADLAEKAHIRDPAYIYQIEKTPTNCGVDIATRLANALGCTIEDLTGAFPKGGKE
jgi:transcriptional regulator with XRE-family HTH domain